MIVDETAGRGDAAKKIAVSKTFDHATSCSSENSVVAIEDVSCSDDRSRWSRKEASCSRPPNRRNSPLRCSCRAGSLRNFIAQSARGVAERAGLRATGADGRGFSDGRGNRALAPLIRYSGENSSPVLAVYRARDFAHAAAIAGDILRYQGAGHSVGLHSRDDARALALGLELPVCRVIVNQAHCFATGGSFDNGVPFSLSMGCGTRGGNSIPDNLNYRHFLNITRVVRPLRAPCGTSRPRPSLFGDYRRKFDARGVAPARVVMPVKRTFARRDRPSRRCLARRSVSVRARARRRRHLSRAPRIEPRTRADSRRRRCCARRSRPVHAAQRRRSGYAVCWAP